MTPSRAPRLVPVSEFMVSVAAGGAHSLALARSRQIVWSWGSNSHGQLGHGTVGGTVPLPAATDVKEAGDVSAGSLHSLAAVAGRFTSWGGNVVGALGNETSPAGSGNANVVDSMGKSARVSAGSWFSLSLGADGVHGCGMNADGQLGIGPPEGASPYYSSAPVKAIVKSVVDIAAGAYHSLMLDKYGEVWACGNNYLGQLGMTPLGDIYAPRSIPKVKNIRAIACGTFHSLLLDEAGRVWSMGNNAQGQLGTGSFDSGTHVVRRVKFKKKIISIGAGAFHSLAVDSEGHVWAWGDNLMGQLGDGTNVDRNSPILVQGLGGVAYD